MKRRAVVKSLSCFAVTPAAGVFSGSSLAQEQAECPNVDPFPLYGERPSFPRSALKELKEKLAGIVLDGVAKTTGEKVSPKTSNLVYAEIDAGLEVLVAKYRKIDEEK